MDPGFAASWPLVLNPPSTAYATGTRIMKATATRTAYRAVPPRPFLMSLDRRRPGLVRDAA